MSTGYSNYSEFESYNDGPLNTSYAVAGYADHVCRPVVVDAEGRKNPIVRYTPESVVVDAEGRKNPIVRYTPEGFVMKAERVVEHVTRAPVISITMTDYKYGSGEKEDVFEEYGVEKRYTPLGSTYDRPEKVGNFLTKIQNEASRPNKPNGPFNTNWRARPISTGQDGNGATKYGDDKDFIKGTNQKIYGIPIGDKQNEGYSHIFQGTNPGNTNKKYNYERPNEGPTVPSRPLSRPTNDIKDAVEFLTEGIKTLESDVNRPTKPGNLATNRWRDGSNFSAHPKPDSGNDELEMFKEPKMYPRDNFEKYYPSEAANPINNSKGYGKTEYYPSEAANPINNSKGYGKTEYYASEVANPINNSKGYGKTEYYPSEAANPINNSKGYGKTEYYASEAANPINNSKGYGKTEYYPSEAANPINNSKGYGKTENLSGQTTSFPGISQQPRFTVPPKEVNSNTQTINSSEAKKIYGKLKPQRLSEEAYSGAINSDDLIKKYNGAKVPW